jgi:hypothetical protein
VEDAAHLFAELWVSLASLLRSYTAAHGLNGNRQATVELGEDRVVVRQGSCWLDLQRQGSIVTWTRENGSSGTVEMAETGRLRSIHPRSQNRDLGHPDHPRSENTELHPSEQRSLAGGPGDLGHPALFQDSGVEQEMDMVAEAWARELMR